MISATDITFDDAGLVPAIVQDGTTRRVLMVAYMNAEALTATQESGLVTFWSRSRGEIWQKGETSGNTLRLESIAVDCDSDALLIQASPSGPTCHTGTVSCFGDERLEGFAALEDLWAVIGSRAEERPDGSYTTSLLDQGPEGPGRKIIEEATEVLLAMKDHERGAADDQRVAEEAADLVYHLLVGLAERGIAPSLVIEELAARAS
jgi:phosphoribosyl-ATP pyrophosphohydrolase/phosphoribosyl-AMP cyclohydrolase